MAVCGVCVRRLSSSRFNSIDRFDRSNAANPVDRAQQSEALFVGSDLLLQQRIVSSYFSSGLVESSQLITQHHTVVLFDEDVECQAQLGQLAAEPALGERGNLLGTAAPGCDRSKHEHPGGTEYIAGHSGELDAADLQQLDDPIHLGGLALNQHTSIAT